MRGTQLMMTGMVVIFTVPQVSNRGYDYLPRVSLLKTRQGLIFQISISENLYENKRHEIFIFHF